MSAAPADGDGGFSDFKFSVEPDDTVAIRDQPARLDCAATYQHSTPTLVWARDGVQLASGDDVRRYVCVSRQDAMPPVPCDASLALCCRLDAD